MFYGFRFRFRFFAIGKSRLSFGFAWFFAFADKLVGFCRCWVVRVSGFMVRGAITAIKQIGGGACHFGGNCSDVFVLLRVKFIGKAVIHHVGHQLVAFSAGRSA